MVRACQSLRGLLGTLGVNGQEQVCASAWKKWPDTQCIEPPSLRMAEAEFSQLPEGLSRLMYTWMWAGEVKLRIAWLGVSHSCVDASHYWEPRKLSVSLVSCTCSSF